MQMKCKCNANEMKCDQMPNKCIILGTIQFFMSFDIFASLFFLLGSLFSELSLFFSPNFFLFLFFLF